MTDQETGQEGAVMADGQRDEPAAEREPAAGEGAERDDQDAGPASRPTGAAAVGTEAEQEDTDAGPASEPQD